MLERVAWARDVVVFKSAQHKNNRVNLSNVCKKLVAQSFAFACAFNQAADVDHFNGGVHSFLGLRHFGEGIEPRVEHFGNANIGVLRGEGVRRRQGCAVCERVI